MPREQPPSGPFHSDAVDAMPFYIVCDVSESMWGERFRSSWGSSEAPWSLMSRELSSLNDELDQDNETRDVAHVSVIEFSGTATVVTPLARVSEHPEIPRLGKGTWTNYVAVWQLLSELIKEDSEKLRAAGYLPWRPTIFFITDGNPGSNSDHQTKKDWDP